MSDTELSEDVIAWNDTIVYAAILVTAAVWDDVSDEISSELWARINNKNIVIRSVLEFEWKNPS